MEGMGGNGPGGYGETSLDGMEKQAWRLWRNKPGWYGETGLEAMEKQGLRGKVLGMFFCFIVFCIFAL